MENIRLGDCWIVIVTYTPISISWLFAKNIKDKVFELKQKTLQFSKIKTLKIFQLAIMVASYMILLCIKFHE